MISASDNFLVEIMYLVLGRDRSYFVSNHSDSTKKLSETDIINMLEFLIDNIIVIFGGRVFQQTVEIKGFDCKSCNLLCFYLFVDDHINIFTSYLPCALMISVSDNFLVESE
jgi:hypothetical protein